MVVEKISYHTHSTVSDGKLSPEELIKTAIKKKFKVLAITDHYTRTKDATVGIWGLNFYSDEEYERMIKLREKYSDEIKILIGAEFDWLPTKKEWLLGEIERREYDIKILSCHLLYIENKYYSFYNEECFKQILDLFDSDIRKFIGFYYENLREGIISGWFDVLGHLDFIKTYNKNSKYFSEDEEWYKEEVLKTLRLVKKFNLKLDVNLHGLKFKIEEQFPSKWIINEAKDMGIELLIGTDAHDSEGLDYDVDFAEELING